MKTTLFLASIFFLAACGGRGKNRPLSDQAAPIGVTAAEKLHPAIVQGISTAIMTDEVLNKSLRVGAPNIPLSESFISVTFVIRPEDKKIFFSDSLVQISYYCFDRNALINKYYKGVIDISDYKVGIFDVGGFGDRYYNADSIKYVPLNKFKPYDFAALSIVVYYIDNGEPKLWNP